MMDTTEQPEGSDQMPDEEVLQSRRDFLVGLRKWSKVVIGGAVLGAILTPAERVEAGWLNRRGGGGWVNRRVGGGSWVNRRVGGGSWVNRR